MRRVSVLTGLPQLAEELLSREVARHPVEEASSLGAKAVLAEAKGEHAEARVWYTAAAEAFGVLEMAPDRAHALQGLGRCLLALGETDEGSARLLEARTLWKQMKAELRIAEIDERLARTSRPDRGSRKRFA